MPNYRKILRTLGFGLLNAGNSAFTVGLYKKQQSTTGFSDDVAAALAASILATNLIVIPLSEWLMIRNRPVTEKGAGVASSIVPFLVFPLKAILTVSSYACFWASASPVAQLGLNISNILLGFSTGGAALFAASAEENQANYKSPTKESQQQGDVNSQQNASLSSQKSGDFSSQQYAPSSLDTCNKEPINKTSNEVTVTVDSQTPYIQLAGKETRSKVINS